MKDVVNLTSRPNFTVDELIQLTGWPIESQQYYRNLELALNYLQTTVPKAVLREQEAAAWGFKINGVTIRLTNWLQGMNFRYPVDPQRVIGKGSPVIAFKFEPNKREVVRGNWFTFPSTDQDHVAIHSKQIKLHKFKAKTDFFCLQSRVADAFVGWFPHLRAEYRHGGGTQLFIWNAGEYLEPI
jgi:hypothetical protein